VQRLININEGETDVSRDGKTDWFGEDIMSRKKEKIIMTMEARQ
jgi:hypothetical protein